MAVPLCLPHGHKSISIMSKMNEKITWNHICLEMDNVWWVPGFYNKAIDHLKEENEGDCHVEQEVKELQGQPQNVLLMILQKMSSWPLAHFAQLQVGPKTTPIS